MEEISFYANDNNVTRQAAAVALKSPLISKPQIWPDTREVKEAVKIETASLCISKRNDLLTLMCEDISEYLQFPKSTAFLHGLSCVSAAMCKSFKIDLFGPDELLPTGIYAVTAQPPSTGKSHVNTKFSKPIVLAYQELNDTHKVERQRLAREIKRIERDLEKCKDPHQEMELCDQLDDKQMRLDRIPEWQPVTTNATPEALEKIAGRNDGLMNILSAESESLKAVTGSMYGNGMNNYQLLLNAWVSEHYSAERVTRDAFNGFPKAAISVIAQDDVVEALLKASGDGRGFGERFLLLTEKSLLGTRNRLSRKPANDSLNKRYQQLIKNIIFEPKVNLKFSNSALEMISSFSQHYEPMMKEDSEYSHNMMTGFLGKYDIHVAKIAAALHVIEHWQDGGQRSTTIGADTVTWANGLYDELLKTYKNAAEYMGYTGRISELQKIITLFNELSSKGKSKVMISQLREKVRNVKPFKGARNISKKIKDEILPALEELNYCLVDGQTIYINPRLK